MRRTGSDFMGRNGEIDFWPQKRNVNDGILKASKNVWENEFLLNECFLKGKEE